MLLRIGLEVVDWIAGALPARVAYALADLGGDVWHRMSPSRRSVVGANLARVCEATGRPTRGRAFDRMVRDAFRNHARYYLELVKVTGALLFASSSDQRRSAAEQHNLEEALRWLLHHG